MPEGEFFRWIEFQLFLVDYTLPIDSFEFKVQPLATLFVLLYVLVRIDTVKYYCFGEMLLYLSYLGKGVVELQRQVDVLVCFFGEA